MKFFLCNFEVIFYEYFFFVFIEFWIRGRNWNFDGVNEKIKGKLRGGVNWRGEEETIRESGVLKCWM